MNLLTYFTNYKIIQEIKINHLEAHSLVNSLANNYALNNITSPNFLLIKSYINLILTFCLASKWAVGSAPASKTSDFLLCEPLVLAHPLLLLFCRFDDVTVFDIFLLCFTWLLIFYDIFRNQNC